MSRIAALAAAAFALTAAPAAADDYAATARNIIPSGQYGVRAAGRRAPTSRRCMYDALTPLFDQVTDADLLSELQVRGLRAGPGRAGASRSRSRGRA